MREAKIDLAGFQETRWPGTIVFPLPHGFWFANIGGGDSSDGVAFVFAPSAFRAIEGINFISSRHIVTTLKC